MLPVLLVDPGTPTLMNVDIVTPNISIKLIVEAPSTRGCGPITAYVVRDISTGHNLTSDYSDVNGNVTITIREWEVGRRYVVRVSAINDRSWESALSSESVTFMINESESFATLLCSLEMICFQYFTLKYIS